MNKLNIKLFLTVLILSFGISVADDEKEKEIPLSDVPKIVMDAAQKAVPGIELSEADVEETPDGLVYELEGILDGKEYEIEISADGTVLNIEEEDHDDDEDDDDEDHEESKETDD